MLTDEQRAVVVSRSRGDLKRESIASALRSCYPDLVIRKRGVAYVEEALAVQGPRDDEIEDDEAEFDDVCQFWPTMTLSQRSKAQEKRSMRTTLRKSSPPAGKIEDRSSTSFRKVDSFRRRKMFADRSEWRSRSEEANYLQSMRP
jgi:hypothetical protein